MGEVWRARDPRLGRDVAVKVLPDEMFRDVGRVARFRAEARAASALNHPSIITIFEVFTFEGLQFIVTEYVDGETLRERMSGSRMRLGEVLDVAIQVSGALSEAHKAGIVHRDIKPENIMIRRDGYVKVLDFGLAKLIEPLSQADTTASGPASARPTGLHTDPGRIMGTTRYMSPEQVLRRKVDGRSDIFSLGVVIHEMITGRPPFKGATPEEVFAEILNHEAPPLASFMPDVPEELERIADKTLAKDPEERYQVVKDLLIDLRRLKLDLELEVKQKRAGGVGLRPTDREEHHDAPKGVQPSRPTPSTPPLEKLEPPGGAVALDSGFYIVRPADQEFHSAIARQDSIVLVKGPRQVGKTSLLARGLQKAREAGAHVVLSDFQNLNASCLQSIDRLFQVLAELIAEELEIDLQPEQTRNPHLSASINFERFLRRSVLAKVSTPIVWGLDEVDWLFTCSFGSEVFGLFRSWHNKRALDPTGPWRRFTLAIAYATEAHLFITDLNQSPFNVGTRLTLEDLTIEQVEELNRRYGSPLGNRAELARFFRLVGGHPYLVRRGLHEMVVHALDLPALENLANSDEGPFSDHLRRMLVSLTQDPALCDVVRGILQGGPCPAAESFYRLRSAGLMSGESAQFVKPRCQLYASYLERQLL